MGEEVGMKEVVEKLDVDVAWGKMEMAEKKDRVLQRIGKQTGAHDQRTPAHTHTHRGLQTQAKYII